MGTITGENKGTAKLASWKGKVEKLMLGFLYFWGADFKLWQLEENKKTCHSLHQLYAGKRHVIEHLKASTHFILFSKRRLNHRPLHWSMHTAILIFWWMTTKYKIDRDILLTKVIMKSEYLLKLMKSFKLL
jgi:hypothetical protein